MSRILLFLVLVCIPLVFYLGFFVRGTVTTKEIITSQAPKQKVKLLEKYEFEKLMNTNFQPGKLEVIDLIKENPDYLSYNFKFTFNPNLDGKTLKVTTGQINLPVLSGTSATENIKGVILMFRGYIDQESYKTGDGTRNAAVVFAQNGFITIAPDFLGYGGSDKESEDIFESRFQTYITALALLKTIESLTNNSELLSNSSFFPLLTAHNSQLFLWGHSNGGQIALTVLELSQTKHPTILWAPVSKPFPYSILYYTDESDDHGKFLRSKLSEFEETLR